MKNLISMTILLLMTIQNSSALEKVNIQKLKNLYKRPSQYEIKNLLKLKDLQSEEVIELGKKLFFDPRLSGSKTMSCATCHQPMLHFSDGLPLAHGFKGVTLERKTPGLYNLLWAKKFMWDGRVDQLELQVKLPLYHPDEMHSLPEKTVMNLQAILEYEQEFKRAFPKSLPGELISEEHITLALAQFVKSLVAPVSAFDRWIAGDEKAISARAKNGFILFNTKARCAECHSGFRMTDDSLHDIGVVSYRENKSPDVGDGQYRFKTPGLRNIERLAPYFHNGSVPTLYDMIEFYNMGGKEKRPTLSEKMIPLGLSEDEKNDLVIFLKTLNSTLNMDFPRFRDP